MQKIIIIFCSNTKVSFLGQEENISNDNRLRGNKVFIYTNTPKELFKVLEDNTTNPCFVVADTMLTSTYGNTLQGAVEIAGRFNTSTNSLHKLVFFAPNLQIVSQEPHLAINSLADDADKRLLNALEEFMFLNW